MKLFSKLFAGAALVASTFAATAQDGPELSISGSVDAYFKTNLSPTNYGPEQAPGSSFTNGNGFSLGMANLILGVEGEKSGFVADLVYGPRGNEAVFYSDPAEGGLGGTTLAVNQLYTYWNVSDAATLTFGNFNTFLGYEVISPAANFNYSTSFMFSNGPFSHTGLKLDYSASDDLSFMLAVMNPTDWTDFNPTDTYTLGAQVGYKGVYLNLIYGDQDGSAEGTAGATFQVDLTAGFDLTEELYLGVNATYNTTADTDPGSGDDTGFSGVAGYLQYALTDAFAIGTRVEYFSTVGGFGVLEEDVDAKGSVLNVTLSAPYKIGDLTLIPEFRLDSQGEDAFIDGDGEPTSSLSTFYLAAVYAF